MQEFLTDSVELTENDLVEISVAELQVAELQWQLEHDDRKEYDNYDNTL